MQKAADPIVGIVRAIDRQLVIQSRAAAGGNGGDARLGGIGRLDWFGSRNEIGDVGKTARRQRQSLQVLAANYATAHCACRVNGFGRDRRRVSLHGDGFAGIFRLQRNRDIANHADRNIHVGGSLSKTFSGYGDVIGPGQQSLKAKLSTLVSSRRASDRRPGRHHNHTGTRHARGAHILHLSTQRATNNRRNERIEV